jgi:hypothetical protein
MKPNRREVLGAGLAGAVGLLGVTAGRLEAHTGPLGNAEVKKLALTPRSPADFRKLAEHFRVLKAEAEAEAALYEAVAKGYRKGIAAAGDSQARDGARALEHVAEHARDTAEALDHLVETYDGLAENFNG